MENPVKMAIKIKNMNNRRARVSPIRTARVNLPDLASPSMSRMLFTIKIAHAIAPFAIPAITAAISTDPVWA